MPKFINTNSHFIYVDLPGRPDEDLSKFRAFEQFTLTGADADVAEGTNGVINLSKADDDTLQRIDEQLHARGLAGIGEDAGKDTSTSGTVTTGNVEKTGSGGEPSKPEETKAAPKKAPAKKAAPKKPAKLPEPPPQVGKGSGTADWAKFAKEIGLAPADDAKKADLVEQVKAELAKRQKDSGS
ncbi:MAG TPA: hypothetical protein VGK41_05450 [Solirubrobacterales bacterium]